jgi:RNA polymerase sigma factor (sigma-70 family)
MKDRDHLVIRLINEGKDDKALSVLYKETLPLIKNLILKNNGTTDEVKDIFQEAILIFYKQVKLNKYKEEHDINGFIYAVSKNLYINYVKKKNKHQRLDIYHEELDSGESFLKDMMDSERQKLVHALMDTLGDRCKELLTLSVFNKFSMKEIAEKMGFANENAAKTGNYKCKQKLIDLVKSKPDIIRQFRE